MKANMRCMGFPADDDDDDGNANAISFLGGLPRMDLWLLRKAHTPFSTRSTSVSVIGVPTGGSSL